MSKDSGLSRKKKIPITASEFRRAKGDIHIRIDSKRPMLGNDEMYIERVTDKKTAKQYFTTEYEDGYKGRDSIPQKQWEKMLIKIPNIDSVKNKGYLNMRQLHTKMKSI